MKITPLTQVDLDYGPILSFYAHTAQTSIYGTCGCHLHVHVEDRLAPWMIMRVFPLWHYKEGGWIYFSSCLSSKLSYIMDFGKVCCSQCNILASYWQSDHICFWQSSVPLEVYCHHTFDRKVYFWDLCQLQTIQRAMQDRTPGPDQKWNYKGNLRQVPRILQSK